MRILLQGSEILLKSKNSLKVLAHTPMQSTAGGIAPTGDEDSGGGRNSLQRIATSAFQGAGA
jgi:hypothetical protein